MNKRIEELLAGIKTLEKELREEIQRIRELLARWKEAARKKHVGSMLIGRTSPEALKVVAEELL